MSAVCGLSSMPRSVKLSFPAQARRACRRGARSASPESITTTGSMDSGPAHPSRLLPTWTMILPNSGKPEFGGASRNDVDDQPRLALLEEEPNSFFKSLMPSESRGHSQENECRAQGMAFARDLMSF